MAMTRRAAPQGVASLLARAHNVISINPMRDVQEGGTRWDRLGRLVGVIHARPGHIFNRCAHFSLVPRTSPLPRR